MKKRREEVEFLIKDQLNLIQLDMSHIVLMRMFLSIDHLTKNTLDKLKEGEYLDINDLYNLLFFYPANIL
jgi:hypothetical protein